MTVLSRSKKAASQRCRRWPGRSARRTGGASLARPSLGTRSWSVGGVPVARGAVVRLAAAPAPRPTARLGGLGCRPAPRSGGPVSSVPRSPAPVSASQARRGLGAPARSRPGRPAPGRGSGRLGSASGASVTSPGGEGPGSRRPRTAR